jgi:acyl-CoA synthetase (NDP forming)/RimJ/RimL family protein N-acetyltransferase
MARVAGPGYPLEWEADVLLRDGHPVHLRPITPADGEALRRFHRGLSARTVYFRFFGAKPELTDEDVAYFTGVDHRLRVALVALDRQEIVGVGRFDALGDGSAEIAFLIQDAMQGRGLGSVLLEHLAAAGREVGVERFVAEVLPENARMLGTFREAGYLLEQRREEDVIAVAFDIEPTAASLAVMAAREHRAEARSMSRVLRPESVAVVGASRRPGGLGHAVLLHLRDGGFTGRLMAVHREVDAIAGVPCVRSLAEAGDPFDLVMVVVPADEVPGVVADAAASGAHALVVVSGGFGDSGPTGLALQAELVDTVRRNGMRLVGPNALGVINTAPDVLLNASLVPQLPDRGGVGFFCQSGALGSSILQRFGQRDLGVSSFVSAGNRADVSGNDLLQYWEDDPDTSAVLLHLETIGNARKFARLVHRVSRTKPVVMVRTGGTGLRLPSGHATVPSLLPQAAVDQVLADCGLVVVETVDRLIDVGRVVEGQELPARPEVAVVSNSDALAVLAENALSAAGLVPVGARGSFARRESAEVYAEAIRQRVHDPDVGAVLVIHVPPLEGAADEGIRSALSSCRGCGGDRHAPVVAVLAGGPRRTGSGGVPVFAHVEEAVHALAAAHGIARWRQDDARRSAAAMPWGDDGPDAGVDVPAGPAVLAGEPAGRLLAEAAGLHVLVDVEGAGEGGCAIALVDDALFGPVVSVGADEAVAGLLGDRAYRLAPVTPEGARDMLASLGAVTLITRGAADPGPVLDDLATAVSCVSALHLTAPGVREATVAHARADRPGELTVGGITVTVGGTPIEGDPTARRL